MALQDAFNELKEKVVDLTSLHVQTYTGTINLGVSHDNERWTALEEALKHPKPDSNVKLAMETMIRFDGDAYNFVSENNTDLLRKTHLDAVKAGLETRKAIIELATNLFE